MPEIPGRIRIERTAEGMRMWVDGEEMPWTIAADNIDVNVRPDGQPVVRLTLVADRVELVDAPFAHPGEASCCPTHTISPSTAPTTATP